jgi:hypothetical protein
MEIDVETLENQVKKHAKKNNVSEETIEKIYNNATKNLSARGLTGEDLHKNALMRVLAALKRKDIKKAKNKPVEGFIISRGNPFDASKKPRNEARAYVDEFGIESAIKEGYAKRANNANGYELLYKDFDWRKGQEIPDEDWKAIGLAMVDIKGTLKIAEVNFKGEAAICPIQFFKICDIPIYVRNNGQFKCDITVSIAPDNYEEDYVDFSAYADKIKKVYPDRILSDLVDVDGFIDDHQNEFGSWCAIEGNVLRITTTKKKKASAIDIDDTSLALDEDGNCAPYMTIYFPQSVPIDFRDDAVGVTFFVSPYRNDDGEVVMSGLGYWADPIDRVEADEDQQVPDSQANWGM